MATTGRPAAIASIKVSGIPSLMLVSRAMSAAASRRGTSVRSPRNLTCVLETTILYQALNRTAFGAFADQNELDVLPGRNEPLQGPDRGGMVLEVIKAGDLDQHQIVRIQADLGPDRLPFRSAEPDVEPLEWDPVVNDLDSPRWDALVVDQGLANGLADSHHPVASSQQHAIGQLPLRAAGDRDGAGRAR